MKQGDLSYLGNLADVPPELIGELRGACYQQQFGRHRRKADPEKFFDDIAAGRMTQGEVAERCGLCRQRVQQLYARRADKR